MIDKIAVVPVASFQSSVAGHACANALESLGINATVVGDHIANFHAGSPGVVDVLVSSKQLEQAKRILEQMPLDLNSSEEVEGDKYESEVMGWKKFMIGSIFWINLVGLFGTIGIWILAVCLLTDAKATDVPPVEVKQLDYRSIAKANDWTGLRLPDAIPSQSVSRVILTELKPHRLSGRLNDELSDQEIRDLASKFTNTLFSETGAIEKWGQLAEEGKVAELAIVTRTGTIFFVDVLLAKMSRNPNAFIIRGIGFSVRVPVVLATLPQ